MRRIYKLTLMIVAVLVLGNTAYSDEVTDWNGYLLESLRATNANAQVATRAAAIVHVAVFDSVNSIERQYAPIHVEPAADEGASRRAAAVQAAYAAMLRLFPTRQAILTALRQMSLDQIAADRSAPKAASIEAGIKWGQTVADAIWEWRSTDGLSTPAPPFLGGLDPGQWRPTPPDSAAGAAVQFATMVPWVIPSLAYFRPFGPPALNSDRYTADFNEVKIKGTATSSDRTADQTVGVFFWASTTPSYLWNTVATSLSSRRRFGLSENARLLAVMNVAMADATISCWDAKYAHPFWRPLTAITLAADDGNPATAQDSTWTPLIQTPAHPEFPSGHSCNSAAAATILARYFGEYTHFSARSEVMFGITRSFRSFSAALEDVKDARIFGGIHFRSACEAGQKIGTDVATFVMRSLL